MVGVFSQPWTSLTSAGVVNQKYGTLITLPTSVLALAVAAKSPPAGVQSVPLTPLQGVLPQKRSFQVASPMLPGNPWPDPDSPTVDPSPVTPWPQSSVSR